MGLNLKKINVSGNPFIKSDNNYRTKLFSFFLSLICVDDCDKEGNDIESTEYGDEQNYFEEEDKSEEIESLEDFDKKLNDNSNMEEQEEEDNEDEDEIENNKENNNN